MISQKWDDSWKINNFYGDGKMKNDTSLTISDSASVVCANYELNIDEECVGNLVQLPTNKTIYINHNGFVPFELEEFEDELINGQGVGIRSRYIQKRWLIFPGIANTYVYSIISAFAGLTGFKLKNYETDEEVEFDRLEVEPGQKLTRDIFQVTLRMRLKNNAVQFADDCDSLYLGAPYEGCDEDSQGTPGSDIDCEDYEIVGQQSGTVLSVSTAGAPGTGTESFRWRYRRSERDNWQTISNNTNSYDFGDNYGIYEVIAFKAGCQTDKYTFTIADPCADFAISIIDTGTGYLLAEATKAPDLITWEMDDGSGWNVVQNGGMIFELEVSGDYRVRAEYGDCEADSNVLSIELEECDFEVDIVRGQDGSLTLVVDGYDGEDDPAYRWEKELSDGVIVPISGNLETIQPDESAIYHGYITLDGCEKGTYELIIDLCEGFEAYIGAVIPGASTYTLYAQITGGNNVDIKWYQMSGSGYVQIGSGNSVTTTQVGNVKMVATSGSCVRVDYTEIAMDFVNPWYYQKFILAGGEDHVTITEFTLPDTDNLHPDRVAWLMEVTENGVEQVYGHEVLPVDLHRLEYSIDGQKVNLNPAYTRAGSIIVVKMKKE